MRSKEEIVKDLEFCKVLMDRLVKDAGRMGNAPWNRGHTIIQQDIIKLRRELNRIRISLDWYED